jgi:hypothetical protein
VPQRSSGLKIIAMFGRRPAKPDAAVLARASDDGDVDLGTYPEPVLAVTGAYPARAGLDPRPESSSSFRRLDEAARKGAMQAALDRLAGEGTLGLAPGEDLRDVVAAGLDGKLPLVGELGELYRLCYWFRRKGFLSGMVVTMAVSEGVEGPAMLRDAPYEAPPGTPPPGVESCFQVPSDDRDAWVLLVERSDDVAGTRSYTLRTLRREIGRMGDFLFPGPVPEGRALRADADMWFRFGPRTLKLENAFIHPYGEDTAIVRIVTDQGRKKKEEPRLYRATRDQLVNGLADTYQKGAARTQ